MMPTIEGNYLSSGQFEELTSDEITTNPDGSISFTQGWDSAARHPFRCGRRQSIAVLLTSLICAAVWLGDRQRCAAQDIEGRRIPISEPTGRLDFAFSPDGKILAVRYFGRMTLWDLDTDKEWKSTRGILVSKESPLRMGKRFDLLIGKGEDLLWGGSQNIEEVDRRNIEGMAFSPDGKSLALSCVFGVLFFDIATGKENSPAILSWGPGKIPFAAEALAFSPDGETLATWDRSESILWDLNKRKMRAKISMLNRYNVWPLSFSPDGKTVAALNDGDERTISLWAVDTGKRRDLSRDDDKGYGIAVLAPDGKTLVAGTRSGALYLWDLQTSKVKAAVADPACRQDILTLAFSPDGRTLVAMHKKQEIALWEVVTRKKRATLRAPGNNWPPLAFSPDGRLLASCCRDASNHSMVQLWNLASVKRKPPDAAETARLWGLLAGEDASDAYRAIRTLTAFPPLTMPLLRKQLHPLLLSEDESRKIDRLLADLDSDNFAAREKASKELKAFGVRAEGALRRVLVGRPTLEVRRRVDSLLAAIERQKAVQPIQQLRALEVLEHIGMAEARSLLADLAKGVPEARLTQEAKASLARLAKRPAPKPQAGGGK
jgi:WD40 repeat protein